jgi:hypothetical protein
MNELIKIQELYRSECNGDLEHQYGIKIETLDNPGWSVEIVLIGRKLFKVNDQVKK